MTTFLETDRMILREFTAADEDLVVELDSDPEVMFFINGGRPTTRAEVRDDVLPYMVASYDRPAGFGYWAAEARAGGRFLGWFQFRPGRHRPPSDGVEIGYRLRRAEWGRGYATEGVRALIDKGFAELGLERVYAEAMAAHPASRRVMEKAGLRYVRTFHQDWPAKIPGDELGDVEYAITRAEWAADRRSTR
ncbi:GNAT family N-acetyltransferase [Actinoplanes sp. NPDC051633]|uniref:GNAT family N-acetyltransferase n=1 Tax=Actinoplanes sp. NPDC051633 TaxID=3155670 RepID=UPI003433122B